MKTSIKAILIAAALVLAGSITGQVHANSDFGSIHSVNPKPQASGEQLGLRPVLSNAILLGICKEAALKNLYECVSSYSEIRPSLMCGDFESYEEQFECLLAIEGEQVDDCAYKFRVDSWECRGPSWN